MEREQRDESGQRSREHVEIALVRACERGQHASTNHLSEEDPAVFGVHGVERAAGGKEPKKSEPGQGQDRGPQPSATARKTDRSRRFDARESRFVLRP
jgi:hypothetical protein